MIMPTLAIDPGTSKSAYVLLNQSKLVQHGKFPNTDVLELIRSLSGPANIVLEEIASYGMAVGAEVFETVFWSGRFAEAAESRGKAVHRRRRLAVKLHHCHAPAAKDSNIRQAVIDRFGGKAIAIGLKNNPGPLYGVKADIWQALALGLMFVDEQKEEARPKAD